MYNRIEQYVKSNRTICEIESNEIHTHGKKRETHYLIIAVIVL